MFQILRLVTLFAVISLGSSLATLRQCHSRPSFSLERIYGGEDARPLEFPWQASLRIRYFDSHICGATLIADNWVLTAAHCFSRSNYASNWKVQLGEHALHTKESSEREFLVSKVLIHEKYNRTNQLYDIALIKLQKSVNFQGSDKHLKPICLAGEDFLIRSGYKCVVTGWGRGEKGPVTTNVLQKLSQPLLNYRECASIWGDIGWPVTERNVCFGDRKGAKGVCNGDSGGPLQCQLVNGDWVQVGITSWTTSECIVEGYAAVFTKVSSYRDWIQEKINQN